VRAPWICSILHVLVGCAPAPGPPPSIVTDVRILALRGDPAEAAPGAAVTVAALVVSPDGTVDAPAVDWARCDAPKPLGENNVVAADCLGDDVAPLGTGPQVALAIPGDVCAKFGPDTPQPKEGEPPLRPRDPDVTGGFYQPIRGILPAAAASGADLVALALERVTCNLAGAPTDVAADFRARYQANRNPDLLDVGGAGGPVAPGAKVVLDPRWSDDSAETFPLYDPVTRTLSDRRETLRLSFYATAGAFAHDRTGFSADDSSVTGANEWTAPSEPSTVHLWAVLRDSRGGVDWLSFALEVAP
jgi:hypothetical protein